MHLNDVIRLRCGDYFSPHFHPSNGELMTPTEFKKISKEHFYNELYRYTRDHYRNLFRLYSLVAPDLDEPERAKLLIMFDDIVEHLEQVELITIPYRPIGEKK